MCANKQFGAYYSLSIFLTRQLQLDSARETVALVDAARERITQDLATLQAGTAQASSLINLWPDLSEKITAVEEADETVAARVKKVDESADAATEKISELQVSFSTVVTSSESEISDSTTAFRTTLKDAIESLAEATKIQLAAKKILEDAQEASNSAKLELGTADTTLKTAIQQEELTQTRLTKALQNAQMESLAGSFTRMKEDTGLVIKTEQKRFEGALIYLILIAVSGVVIEGYLGFPKTTLEEFWIRMLKMLSLAAPGIWIAWITSKKLNALNRVFSDYEYKSAAALAYESYRQTVAEAGMTNLNNSCWRSLFDLLVRIRLTTTSLSKTKPPRPLNRS